MNWVKPCLAIVAISAASAACAQIIVVRATGPSAARYKPGTTLSENQPVTLRPGDMLTLLDEKGSWTLLGPSNALPRVRMQRVAAPQLLAVNDRRARIGAVRSVDGTAKRPNLWLVDIGQSGTTCIVDPAKPMLWRADTTVAGKTTLSGPGNSSAEIDWTVGQATHDWPTSMPVTPGASYRLTGTGTAKGTTVSLTLVDHVPASVSETGKALITHGCSAQLDLLLAEVGDPETDPAGS